MNLRDKIGITGGTVITPEIQSYLNEVVVTLINRSNKGRDTAVANLRLEVYELSKKIEALSGKVEVLLPLAKSKLIDDIESLNTKVIDIKKENCYKKFFSGANGFLYQLPDILFGVKGLDVNISDLNDVNRFYAKNFYPVSNNVIVLNSSLNSIEDNSEVSQMSFDELINLRAELTKIVNKYIDFGFPSFYSNLWNAIENYLLRLCDPNYEENLVNTEPFVIKKELQDLIGNIEKELTQNGIEIIYSPTEDCENGFMPSVNSETSSKPLVRRARDKYIYAYGLYNKEV